MIYGNTKRDFYAARNFFNNIIVHIASIEKGYLTIQTILKEIKNSTDHDNYYVNISLQNAENSYVQSLITIPTLEESIELVENLR